jgi:hypothetical protein
MLSRARDERIVDGGTPKVKGFRVVFPKNNLAVGGIDSGFRTKRKVLVFRDDTNSRSGTNLAVLERLR